MIKHSPNWYFIDIVKGQHLAGSLVHQSFSKNIDKISGFFYHEILSVVSWRKRISK